jgi:hypothetical protein
VVFSPPLAKDRALPTVCLSLPTSCHAFGCVDGEMAGKIRERKENRKLLCWGRWEGRWENGFDFVCVVFFFVVVCNFP